MKNFEIAAIMENINVNVCHMNSDKANLPEKLNEIVLELVCETNKFFKGIAEIDYFFPRNGRRISRNLVTKIPKL